MSMQSMVQVGPRSNAAIWTGRILSGIVVAFMIFDGGIQVLAFDFVTKGMAEFNIPGDYARPLGVVTLACTAFYAVPKTSVFGAILLTGFLGGTIATHLPGADPLLPHVAAALVIALFVWGGLWLRNPQLRALVPLRRG
jgi:DoxX-like family